MAQMSGSNRLLIMEKELKGQELERDELTKKLEHLAKVEKTHSNALGRYNRIEHDNTVEQPVDRTAALLNELRVWKEKVQRLETQQAKEEATRKNQEERIKSVQEENRIYQEKIEEIRKSRNITLDEEPDIQDINEKKDQEIERLNKQKKELMEKNQ